MYILFNYFFYIFHYIYIMWDIILSFILAATLITITTLILTEKIKINPDTNSMISTTYSPIQVLITTLPPSLNPRSSDTMTTNTRSLNNGTTMATITLPPSLNARSSDTMTTNTRSLNNGTTMATITLPPSLNPRSSDTMTTNTRSLNNGTTMATTTMMPTTTMRPTTIIPFIPKFKNNSNEQMGADGNYKIDIRNANIYPCIDIGPGTYKNSSFMGVLLDNDITTGVDIEKYHIGGPWLPYIIVITLPVEKTFKGIFKLDLLSPWGGQTLPRKISLATFNSNAFTSNWWANSTNPIYISNDLPHRLENIDLPEVGNGSSAGPFNYSFNVNFTRPFKHIALLIHSGWNQTGTQEGKAGAVWINNLEFINDA